MWQPAGNAPWNGTPFAVSLGGPVGAETGQRVALHVLVTQPAGRSSQATLVNPLQLRACIYPAQKVEAANGARWVERGAPVWEFILPPLSSVEPGRGAQLNFSWDTRDSQGGRVAPGVYLADLAYPSTVDYKVGGKQSVEELPATPAASMTLGQYFREPIFVGAPNSAYPEDPLIQALASQLDMTIYVPSSAPGSPEVKSASTFAPPPLPGIPPTPIPSVPPSHAVHASIYFGDVFDEYLRTAPTSLLKGMPAEQRFTVVIDGTPLAAEIHKAGSGYSYTQGDFTSYQATVNIGDLTVSLESFHYTEAQLTEVAKTMAPVVAVEPS